MMRRIPILILTIALLTISSAIYADTITSTVSGGLWSDGYTWVGGIAPGSYDDAIVVGPVEVAGTKACQNLVVETTGSVGSAFAGPYNTLQVSGSVINGGTIFGNIVEGTFNFFLEVGGDLHNGGTWANHQTTITGMADRYVSHNPGTGFTTDIVFGPEATGDLIATNPFFITGYVDVTGGRMVLQEECPFDLDRGAFSGELLANGNTMSFISWSYLEQATLDDVVLVGEVEASFSVDFTTRVTVQDTLRNSSGGGAVTIHGDLINNGLITNHQYGFAVFLYGNLENYGRITNSQIEFKGEAIHHISMSPDAYLGANVFLPEFQARTLVADTPVQFADGLGLGVGKLVLMPGSSLRFTEWGGVGSGTIEANGNEISVDGSSALGNVTIDRGILANQVVMSGDNLFTNGVTVTGTLTSYPWAGANITVEGLLLNEGKIQDGDHPVVITALNGIQNLGTITTEQIVLAGEVDQTVGAGPGIDVPAFVMESGLHAASYQWYRDGAPLPGEYATNLTLATVGAADYGVYHCVGDGLNSRSIIITESLGVADVPGAGSVALLEQNHPNPFNPATDIAFSLSKAGKVSLVVYDLAGRQVAHLVNGERGAGRHVVSWQARDLASGTYVYRLHADGVLQSRKCLLLK
jgi:hypothetical protein